MAKISVLVLDERYHGYYLHCDSPAHAHADTDMATLTVSHYMTGSHQSYY